MPKQTLLKKEIDQIQNLRKTGHTLYEIKTITGKANGTVWKYIQQVSILPAYQEIWKIKRGGSKARAINNWNDARKRASKTITAINAKEQLLILAALYWGEGNKTEFNVINSDPSMIRVIMNCLKNLGVPISDFKISLRLFEEIDKNKAKKFWSTTLSLPKGYIQKIDIIKGKKIGKLKYGMCRLRIKKGGQYFKLLMSVIDLIKQL